MKLILGVNAIKPPLTGIGRYTYELATRLYAQTPISSMRCFFEGRWIDDVNTLLRPAGAKQVIRQRLLRSRLAVASYQAIAPHLISHRLKRFSDHVYHGPNFYLPQFPGKKIATIHDLSIYNFPQHHPPERVRFMEVEIDRTLSRADFLITDSEYVRAELIKQFNWNPAKVKAIPLGVTEDYYPRTAAEVAPTMATYGLSFGSYTLCVSTIEPRKNLSTLLTSYARLSPRTKAACPLVLVGSKGWDSSSTYAQILRAQNEGWLKYLGYVSECELPRIYAGARAFVYPSIYEGFGLPVAEAMASGLPVLTSNSSSLAEVSGSAGLSVDPMDDTRMAELLLKMIEDEPWRAGTKARLVDHAKNFNWSETVRLTEKVYEHVNSAM